MSDDQLQELDPDLILDMPEQQAGGAFGLYTSEDVSCLYDKFEDGLAAGFGNIQAEASGLGGIFGSHMEDVHFSLADELAGALRQHHSRSNSLSAELDLANNDQGDDGIYLPTVSIHTSPRRSKASRTSTQYTDSADRGEVVAADEDLEATIADMEASLGALESFQLRIKDYDNGSLNGGITASDAKIEMSASKLIRSCYEIIKQNNERAAVLEVAERDCRQGVAWPNVPMHQIQDSTEALIDPTAALESQGKTYRNVDSVPESQSVRDLFNTKYHEAMAQYRTHTDALLSCLSAISEHLQVNKASSSETWRKLRSMENHLARLRSEADSIQISQKRIAVWESDHDGRYTTPSLKESMIPGLARSGSNALASTGATASPGATGKSRFSSQARLHIDFVQNMLESAEAEARRLLTVPT